MLRQRLRERTSPLMLVGRLVTLMFALALVWYGLMTLLLALKVSPSTVNTISGYRAAFDWLSGLTPADVDGAATRAIIAAAGIPPGKPVLPYAGPQASAGCEAAPPLPDQAEAERRPCRSGPRYVRFIGRGVLSCRWS